MRAIFYAAPLVDDNGECSMRPLIDWLQYNGYSTSIKSTKRRDAGQLGGASSALRRFLSRSAASASTNVFMF
jgi:hypothetical protein